MTQPYAAELEVACRAVRRAAVLCQKVQEQLVTPDTLQKKDRSPVTVADFASQAVVCAMLSETLPDDQVVGEEDAGELRQPDQAELCSKVVEHIAAAMGQSVMADQALAWIDRGGADASTDRYWTLDPIDGTKGFLRGEQYAVALALIERGQVVLGVLGCPNLPGPGESHGVLMTAVKGQGAQAWPLLAGPEAKPTPATVADDADPAQARFCESVESGHSDQDTAVLIAKRLGITAQPVRMDSQAKYAIVGRGEASIYMRLPTRPGYQEKIWDHAAGMIVVQEAGGKVTDIHGAPLDFTQGPTLAKNQGVIATNGPIHEAVIQAVAAEFKAP